jgi:RND family efflux transporter MFP subunit
MKPTLVTTATLLALAALAAGCGRKPPPAPADVRPVRSTLVRTTDAAAGATYAGQVMARHESKLGFQTSGKVVARLVEVGSHVRRGQALMRLDPAQESLHLASANAQVDGAQSRVDELRIDIARTEQLLARQFASQAELDRQRTALAEASSQLESARAQREIRLNQRGYTELRADRDGVVTALQAEVGQVVSPGQVVVQVAAQGEREVLVSVPESRVHELRDAHLSQRPLQISIWARPDKRYAGTLRELAPDADSVTRTYSARITVKDADAALMLGMTASVHAPEAARAQAIRLPLAAIHHRDGQPLVWVVQGNQVSARPVKLAGTSRDGVLVASGLADGDQVVTAGAHLLHEGQAVASAPAQGQEGQQGLHGAAVAQAVGAKP